MRRFEGGGGSFAWRECIADWCWRWSGSEVLARFMGGRGHKATHKLFPRIFTPCTNKTGKVQEFGEWGVGMSVSGRLRFEDVYLTRKLGWGMVLWPF